MRYKAGEDTGLDMHRDNSDVSFTVCLGREFQGGGLNFCGLLGKPNHRKLQHRIHHKVGRCITHLGYHRHGVEPTTSGERISLVMWAQSAVLRGSRAYEDRIMRMKNAAVEE